VSNHFLTPSTFLTPLISLCTLHLTSNQDLIMKVNACSMKTIILKILPRALYQKLVPAFTHFANCQSANDIYTMTDFSYKKVLQFYVHLRKSINDREGKPEQKTNTAFMFSLKLAKCFCFSLQQSSKQVKKLGECTESIGTNLILYQGFQK
jgi:hypothetical protein